MQGPTKFSVKIPESVPESVRVKAKKASRIKIGGLDCIGDGMNKLATNTLFATAATVLQVTSIIRRPYHRKSAYLCLF